MSYYLGADPALAHGAIVEADWRGEELVDWSIIYQWGKKQHIGIHSTTSDLINHCNTVVGHLAPIENGGAPIGIDFDMNAGYWGGGKASLARFSFFMGYFHAALMNRGYIPVDISPREVRKAFHIPGNALKTLAVSAFLQVTNLHNNIEIQRSHEDIKDALCLSYLISTQRRSDSESSA